MEQIGFSKQENKPGALTPVISDTCIDTQLLLAELKKAYQETGEVQSGVRGADYKRLSSAISSNVQERTNYSHLITARRQFQKEVGVATDIIPNVGVRFLLTGKELSSSTKKDMGSIHRKTNKAIRKLSCATAISNLSNDDRIQVNAIASHLGVINYVTSTRKTHMLESAVASQGSSLSLAKTLEHFEK